MGGSDKASGGRPAHMDEREWHLREELAACYRVFDFLGWSESIFNHISLRVPGPERHYLVNPFGLNYSEVTAANLVKVDLDGNPVAPSEHGVNPAGFPLHGAIHGAREDARCVMHLHTTAGAAVACKQHGLSHDNFYGAQLAGQVGYHEFEGITLHPAERSRIVASLGDCSVLILRSHGLVTCGPDVPTAFWRMWTLQRACEVQLAVESLAGRDQPICPAVREACVRDAARFDPDIGRKVFDAAVREMEAARSGRHVDYRA